MIEIIQHMIKVTVEFSDPDVGITPTLLMKMEDLKDNLGLKYLSFKVGFENDKFKVTYGNYYTDSSELNGDTFNANKCTRDARRLKDELDLLLAVYKVKIVTEVW